MPVEKVVLNASPLILHYTPVLDDILAKKCARSLGIQTMGTGSVLILAKERGLIESVEQSLRKLQNAGLMDF